jgi:hypothetical protein
MPEHSPTITKESEMSTKTQLTPEEIVERNLRVVNDHFHNENPADIDKAIALYADDIVWEVPARGVLHETHAAVKDAYIKTFKSYQGHSITFLRRVAARNWVFDDSIVELTLVGDLANNVPHCPLPVGTRCSIRLIHFFEFDDDGRITRENGYEIWRRADGAINDDIPPDAVTVRLDETPTATYSQEDLT